MNAVPDARHAFTPGDEIYVSSTSPLGSVTAVFEDDGDTGYFYAVERGGEPNIRIPDAVQIYVARNVIDRDEPSELVIIWSADGLKSALLINDYPHAVFDFAAQRGYCRTGFPAPSSHWPAAGHEWSDSVMELFA
jgi:hypothetical protein